MPRASKAASATTGSKVKATMAKAVNAIKGKKKQQQTTKAAAPVPSAVKRAAAPAKSTPAKSTSAKSAKSAVAKAPAAKAPAKAAKKAAAPAKKAPAPAAKAAKKAAVPVKKAPSAAKAVKKAAAAPKKAGASTKAAPVKKTAPSPAPAKTTTTTKSTTKPVKAPAPPPAKKEAPAKVAATKKATGKAPVLDKFLEEQQALLFAERREYEAQAAALKAEADSLAQEMEPGDIQFDEESGEGGTMNIDRERDLALSAQARLAVDEIDHALAKILNGTYGDCERCGQPIPKARLKALPYARLCVGCKSGGLSRR